MKAVTSSIANTDKNKILIMLRILNIINGLLLGLSCVFAFTIIEGSVTRFFLALYIGLFALLLLAFELRVNRAEEKIKKHFGFLYTYIGRTTFLLFLGAINFGMVDSANEGTSGRTVVIAVGVITITNAVINCLIICNHPAFRQTEKKPMTEEEIIAYIKEHPEVAAKASADDAFETARVQAGGDVAVNVGAPAPAAAAYVPPASADSGFSSVPLSPAPAPAASPAKSASPARAASPAPAPTLGPAGALPPPLPPRSKPAAGGDEPNPFNPDANPFE